MCWAPTKFRRPAFLMVLAGAWVLPGAARADADAGVPPDGGITSPAPAAGAAFGADAIPSGPDTVSLPPEPAPEDETPAYLHGTVNDLDMGDLFVILKGKDVLIKVADLEKPGLEVRGGVRMKRGDDTMVSLQSLAPLVTFVFDERKLSLTITANPKLFQKSVLDLHAKRPEGIIYGTQPSLFLNYQVRASDLQEGRGIRVYGFAESGLSLKGHLLYGSVQRSDNDGSWHRLMTNMTFDWRRRLTSLILGDTTATGDALGGGMMMGGLSARRDFTLDPYYVYFPTQSLSGTALTPSTVEVYVNGQLVRRDTIAPGQFTMQNLPVTSGSGNTRVVVRDAYGNTQTAVTPYYMALGTLAKGLHDFSYNVGFVRKYLGTDSWNYGQAGFLFRHRYGLTNWLTLAARAEGTRDRVSGGPSLVVRLPVGELGLGAAISGQDEFVGHAALLSYSYIGHPVSGQIGIRWQDWEYGTLSQAPGSIVTRELKQDRANFSTDRQRLNVMATVARTFGQVVSLSLQNETSQWYRQGWNNRVSLMANRTITKWMYAFATLSNSTRSHLPAEYSTFVGLSFTLAPRVMAAATRSDTWGGQSNKHTATSQAMVQQSLPIGSGLGYRLVLSQGQSEVNQANVQYQGAYGRVEADYMRNGYDLSGKGNASLAASGGVVLIGGRPFITRPVQDSYALIRVPGVANVRGTLSNQDIGTTDRNGDLLIPNLLHYYGNRVGINDKDIPLDYDIGATERTIAPPFRGGMVVPFPVRRVLSVAGTAVVEDKGATTIPAYGQIVVDVDGKQALSPLDEVGSFYIENLSPGTYPAEVQHEAGLCKLTLVVPQGSTALVSLGTVRCVVPGKETK
jgi:outer membrane usher protein